MTSPLTPGGLIAANGAAAMPTNADGTPNFTAGMPVSTGNTTIWTMPSGLNPNSAINYDTVYNDSGRAADLNPNRAKRPDGGVTLPDAIYKGGSANSLDRLDVEDIYKQYAALSKNDPMAFLAFQQTLADGPWSTKVNLTGTFDQATQKALGESLLTYLQLIGQPGNETGVSQTYKDYLFQAAQDKQNFDPTSTRNGGGGGGGGRMGVQLSDPASLRATAQQAALAALGHGLDDKQLSSFVDQFHAAEMSNYQQRLAGTDVNAVDPSSQAEQFVTQGQFAAQHQQHQVQSLAQLVLNDMLSGSAHEPAPTPSTFDASQVMGS